MARITGAVALLLLMLGAPVAAQEAEAGASPAEVLLDSAALDDLVAPVALYPDALLAQVFVAATYPLDVIKAQRWAADNAELAEDARVEAAEAEGWDPSIGVLAAGFPDVIDRMADEIDWTERLGEAVMVQTEDVMDAVQRQRARAAALGNLDSNAAQTVTTEDEAIAIAPADPEVVYVPAYDPELVYAETAPAPATVATDPADDGYDSGALLATGVISFGAGMLVNEIFDDDDDWDDYWRGPPPIGWGGGSFYPRPGGVNVGGDVNIDVDRDRPGRPGEWAPDPDRKQAARDKLAGRGEGGRTRPARPAAGGGDRAALKDKLKARSGGGDKALGKPGAGLNADRKPGAKKGVFAGRTEGLTGAKKAKARGEGSVKRKLGGANRAKTGGGPKRLAKGGGGKKAIKKGGGGRKAAFKKKSGGGKARAAKARGGKHAGKLKRR